MFMKTHHVFSYSFEALKETQPNKPLAPAS